ncbi:cold-shock protein [Altererythrobacter xixiisoli]|uniref:Cold-shock protein n=1 Tax=Croceibacterium xixiisoli TaxID=1476466 RepID=A0A6I4U0J3_9SPHN|nr:cold shock domain-containing protein [Croceibacterium xixiisoli]MXP00478.1 cold-shock protein [Croceibacterium xixiisoli]
MIHTGIVQSFSAETGIGVIKPDDGSAPIGVAIEAVRAAGMSELSVDQRLTYEIERHDDGTMKATSLIADE